MAYYVKGLLYTAIMIPGLSSSQGFSCGKNHFRIQAKVSFEVLFTWERCHSGPVVSNVTSQQEGSTQLQTFHACMFFAHLSARLPVPVWAP